MKKPAMIIDVLAGGHGPGDDDEDEDEMDESSTPSKDPAALIASIEQQLSELRQYVSEMS